MFLLNYKSAREKLGKYSKKNRENTCLSPRIPTAFFILQNYHSKLFILYFQFFFVKTTENPKGLITVREGPLKYVLLARLLVNRSHYFPAEHQDFRLIIKFTYSSEGRLSNSREKKVKNYSARSNSIIYAINVAVFYVNE